jgi:MFS family permease
MFKLKDNIQKLYLANFLTGLVFWYGIEKLFMTEIGISPFGVSIIATVFFVVVLLLDIPSGVLADKWNRKYTLILALLMLAISTLIFGLSNGLGLYIFGIVFYGFYVVLTSGTYQAIMYDSLHEMGLHKKYDKYQGKAYAMFLVGVTIASLASGHIANAFGYRSTFFVTILAVVLAVLILITIVEPKFHKLSSESKFFDHLSKSKKIVLSNSFLLQLAVFSVISRILLNFLNEYGGLYFIALGFLAIPSGYAIAGQGLVAAIGEVLAEKIGRKAL